MSEAAEPAEAGDEEQPKKKSKVLLFGVVGALLLGGVSFYGVYSGLIPLPFGEEPASKEGGDKAKKAAKDTKDPYSNEPAEAAAFVPVEEIVISLGPEAKSRHLKLVVNLEVVPGTESTVTALMPRVMDVLNTYLRAVDERDFESPNAMMRLRAQMLRRVQLVTPETTVRDVLIQQFILN